MLLRTRNIRFPRTCIPSSAGNAPNVRMLVVLLISKNFLCIGDLRLVCVDVDDQFLHQFLVLLIDQDEARGISDQLLSSLIVSNFCLSVVGSLTGVLGVSPSRDGFHDEHARTESINRDETSLRGCCFSGRLAKLLVAQSVSCWYRISARCRPDSF